MESKGELIVMRECEWKLFLKSKSSYPQTKIHNILCKDNETSLLDAIKSDKAFGFIGKNENEFSNLKLI